MIYMGITMETLRYLRAKAKIEDESYHTDLATQLNIESSQGEAIPGIEDNFKARRKAYRELIREILKLEKELGVEPHPDIEYGTDGFHNPFK